MRSLCRDCQSELSENDGPFRCKACDIRHLNTACCPDCLAPLEVLKACGAVDFFCRQHGLISSSRVIWQPAEPSG